MDIMHVYPEDAGSYTLKATNALGQAVNSADLHVKSNEVIVKETMHAAAVEQISHMEQQSQISQVSCFEQNPFKIEISGWPLEGIIKDFCGFEENLF